MPARTGAEYITGLKNRPREVWIDGERVKDVTTHPALKNGVKSVAALYDMQHDAALREEMTFASPSTGDAVGLSFSGAPHGGGPGTSPPDDDPVGAGQLRHDGAVAGLPEYHFLIVGRGLGLFCPGPPGVPGGTWRPTTSSSGENDVALTHALVNLAAAAHGQRCRYFERGSSPHPGQGNRRRNSSQGQPGAGDPGAHLRRNCHLPGGLPTGWPTTTDGSPSPSPSPAIPPA